MPVTVYLSTDASAPTLNGTAGALINVLDACLVNGYGSKAAAGWTKSYSGTNKAAYRQPSGSNQFYLRVDDSGTTLARIVGYESMSDVDTGTGAFPTETQFSGGLYVGKSNTADSTSRPWCLITNGKFIYFLVNFTSATPPTGYGFMYGDVHSYKSGDAYNTYICGGINTNIASHQIGNLVGSNNVAATGNFMARSYTQTGTSIAVSKLRDIRGDATAIGYGALPYPSPVDSSMQLSRILIHEPNIATRGYLPGAYQPLHQRPVNHLDTFSGSGEFSGKTFIAVNMNSFSSVGQIIIETSNTW